MKRAPEVIKAKNTLWYKCIKPYKFTTRKGLYGYFGGYWKYSYDKDGNLIKKWLFQCVQLAEWQLEDDLIFMCKRFGDK